MYKKIDNLPVLSHRSAIGTTTSISSIFFAKFYTSFHLISVLDELGECSDEEVQQSKALKEFWKEGRIGPNEHWKKIAAKTLADVEEMTEAEIAQTPTYARMIGKVFNDSAMTTSFLALEKGVLRKVEFGTEAKSNACQ